MEENSKKKPSKKIAPKQSRTSREREVGGLAKCILETLKENSKDENEAFENYALQLRIRLFKDENILSDRLAKGYEALLSSCNHPTR